MNDQIEAAAAVTVRHYFVLAFLVSLGALQIAVSISGMRGLWLVPHRTATRGLGVLLIVAGVAFYVLAPLWIDGPWAAGTVFDGTSEGRAWGTSSWSELSAARNINDIHGGMAGTAYAVYFFLSAVLAFTCVAAIGALNMHLFGSTMGEGVPTATDEPEVSGRYADGLDRLQNGGIKTTVVDSLNNLRRNGRDDATSLMRDTHRWSVSRLIERTLRD